MSQNKAQEYLQKYKTSASNTVKLTTSANQSKLTRHAKKQETMTQNKEKGLSIKHFIQNSTDDRISRKEH